MKPSISILLLLLSVGACGPSVEVAPCFPAEPVEPCKSHVNPAFLATAPPAGAIEAIGIVLDIYSYHSSEGLPSIAWYDGSRLDCPDHPRAFAIAGNASCADGQFYSDTNQIVISDWGGNYPIHQLALAHELCHWWALKTTGNGDAGHTGLCKSEGQGGIIDAANLALTAAGY